MFHENTNYQSVKVLENLYGYLWQGIGNNCNTYLFTHLLEGKCPHVLIDPGHISNEFGSPCFDQLLAALQKDGFDAASIGLIINTHAHPDHCEANQALKQKNGEVLIALSQIEDEFRKTVGEKLYTLLGMTAPVFEPFLLLREGQLKLGEISLCLIHTPGHSPGSISIYWEEKKVLITGDVLFVGSIGRTDFPGGDISHLEQSINKLASLEIDYLLTGHATEYGSILTDQDKIKRNFQMVRFFF
jgi:glyoxylase-like metal-dependent hydrolase (beta-lactamase superfamily II)